MIKLLIFLFSMSAFAVFEINTVEITCLEKNVCKNSKGTFDTLQRKFVDEDHFRRVIKLYSLAAGIKQFEYKVINTNSVNKLLIFWSPKKLIDIVKFRFKGKSLEIPSVLPIGEGDFLDEIKLDATKRLLTDLYKNQGYPNTTVSHKVKYKKKGLVNVTFKIKLYKPDVVRELIIHSESVFVKELFNRTLYQFVNKPFNDTELRKELDLLKALLNDYGYYLHKLSLKTEKEKSSVKITIAIDNLSNHAYDIKFEDQLDQFALSLKSLLRENTIIARRRLGDKSIKEQISNKLKEEGYLNSQITVKRQNIKNIRGEIQENVSIKIKQNKKTLLNKVSFKGNNIVSSSELKKLFYENGTSQVSSDVIDTDYYKSFLSVIKKKYVELGYVNVFLESPEIVQSLDKENGKNSVDLLYRIREGARARINNIVVLGLPKELSKEVLSELQMKKDDSFNPILFKENIEKIKDTLKDKGYFFSELTSQKYREIIKYNKDNTKVSILLDFDLGKLFSVGEIIVVGNYKTRTKVIMRELLFKKGDLLRSQTVSRTQTRILSTGLFSSVLITPIENASSRADVLITVKEKDYGLVEIAPGIRNDLGPKVSGKLSYNNIDGLHKQLTFQAQVNQRLNLNSLNSDRRSAEKNFVEYRGSLNYTENYLFDSAVTLESSISHLRRRFFAFDADITKFTNTFSLDFTHWLTTSLTYELEFISQYNATEDRDDGQFQIGSLTPSFTMDFRNNRTNATSGAFFSLSTEFANPSFLSQENDELVINYYKITSRNRFYIPHSNGTIALSFTAGLQKNDATTLRDDGNGGTETEGYIPNIKLFRLAGLDNVRGYEDDEINRLISGEDISEARVDDTAYMVNIKIEPRLFLSDSTMLGVFYDAGRVFVNDYDLSRLRSSVGLSFKYLTPVGSLDFDYGIKLLRKKDSSGTLESPGRLHVSIGFF